MKFCGRRAIPMALRPPLSIKRTGATANLCIIARAQPAEVSEPLITSLLWKPAATEVGCGIELSLCSSACPSGTIYTSFWPNIYTGLLRGTSVGWPPVSVWICRSDNAVTGMDGVVHTSTFDVANRRLIEALG
ncbi:hypothetical protein THAOC_24789 [Thalassiosira oceanica]|uniref:Uncharacterized protein n=1 Tax=Thalassiosira oceanica TaxID=159749 RepID=K0RNW8_THAOC|nr:hypothetical protein THAOC_24789 [Thalassiosira oceanica]|eukprot:EJK55478.1 hypothetical protein THAOC_24789 [Thalassiosira oceanica]